jgi:hypothetical protein
MSTTHAPTITATAVDVPTTPGTPFAGGFYAGRIRTRDAVYALIVAPKAEGETQGKWLPRATDVPAACSCHDGRANTAALAEAGSPLAKWAQDLRIEGHDDWYLPSRDELEVLYRALKPTTQENWTHFRDGENPSAEPIGYPYTKSAPAQTEAGAFRDGSEQAFESAWHWSSTQYSPGYAWDQVFADGYQSNDVKSYAGRARAVRRLVIE